MLLHLYIRDFALIQSVDLEFGSGLNIITGETGSGKSILIEAITAALGGKVSGELIRYGAEYAYIELTFHIEPEKKKILEALEIELEEENTLILSRKIMAGRSVCKVNDKTVTVKKIRQLSNLMMDIHSQHEHQSLLQKQKHLELLDVFSEESINLVKMELAKYYDQYKKLLKYLETFTLDEEQRLREISFCQFEIQEIETANLKLDEEESLKDTYKKLSHGQKILQTFMELSRILGSQSADSVGENLGRAIQMIQEIRSYDTRIEEIALQLNSIEDILNSTCREILDYSSDISCDENELRQIEERLDLVRHLQMKYGNDYNTIMQNLERKRQRVAELENYEENRLKAQESLKVCKAQILNICEQLSDIRQNTAAKISQQIAESLKEINFLDIQFEIQIKQLSQFTANGFDEAEFMISTNPGEPIKPLADVASGGELSRIMLAIKTVLADMDDIPTLIFDEIDTGISGRTAQYVSEKLACVAKYHQILCITHLPQIAAMADEHFLICKNIVDMRTQTQVMHLSTEESVTELARLLGGVKITDKVLQSAKEMKELAKEN